MDNTTKLYVAYTLWKEGMTAQDIGKRVEKDRATVYRWVKQFHTRGIKRTVKEYTLAKKRNRVHKKTSTETRKLIYLVRKTYSDCCGEKIQYYLKKEYGIEISVVSIYRILKERYVIHNTYRKKKYGEAPKGKKPLEVIQCDTVDFGDIFAHTSIDTYTRRSSVILVPNLTSLEGYKALREHMKIFGHVHLLQSDGGSEFKGEFLHHVLEYADEYREARAYKKNEQSFIESFNRTLRKECLGWRRYELQELKKAQYDVNEFMQFYHEKRPHLGLHMLTPAEFESSCRI